MLVTKHTCGLPHSALLLGQNEMAPCHADMLSSSLRHHIFSRLMAALPGRACTCTYIFDWYESSRICDRHDESCDRGLYRGPPPAAMAWRVALTSTPDSILPPWPGHALTGRSWAAIRSATAKFEAIGKRSARRPRVVFLGCHWLSACSKCFGGRTRGLPLSDTVTDTYV